MPLAARQPRTFRSNCIIPKQIRCEPVLRGNRLAETFQCSPTPSKPVRANLRRVDSFESMVPTHRGKNQASRPTIAVSDPPAAVEWLLPKRSQIWHRWSHCSDQPIPVKPQPSYLTQRQYNLLSQAGTPRTILSKPEANLS